MHGRIHNLTYCHHRTTCFSWSYKSHRTIYKNLDVRDERPWRRTGLFGVLSGVENNPFFQHRTLSTLDIAIKTPYKSGASSGLLSGLWPSWTPPYVHCTAYDYFRWDVRQNSTLPTVITKNKLLYSGENSYFITQQLVFRDHNKSHPPYNFTVKFDVWGGGGRRENVQRFRT